MKVTIYTKSTTLTELIAITSYLQFERIPYQVIEGFEKVTELSGGKKSTICVLENGDVVGGFYDLVKFTEIKGLRRI